MKNSIKKNHKSVLGFILTMSILFSSFPVLACEQPSQNEEVKELTDAADIAEAKEILGVTDEEAENMTFYSATVEAIEPGVTTMPTFRMESSYNRGQDRIFNGSKLNTALVVIGSSEYANLHVRFCSYQDVIWFRDLEVTSSSNRAEVQTGFYNLYKGGTYYMTYEKLGSATLQITVIFGLAS